jgi:molybdopterin-binding protein
MPTNHADIKLVRQQVALALPLAERLSNYLQRHPASFLVNPPTSGEVMSIQAINVRNQFRGKAIIEGPVVSEADVHTPAGMLTSVITTRSMRDHGLVEGSEVVALDKATGVSIAKL